MMNGFKIFVLLSCFIAVSCGGKNATGAKTETKVNPPAVLQEDEKINSVAVSTPILDNINQWVELEGGIFQMGSSKGRYDNRPPQGVLLSDFSIHQTEVTVAQYARCMDAKECDVPVASVEDELCNFEDGNWKEKNTTNHPINCVTWQQAKTYCEWVGGTLPTEAQWEYAARSMGTDAMYPWGNEPVSCEFAVVNDVAPSDRPYNIDENKNGCRTKRTWPVCSKPNGNTAQGLCDMAGNAWEWVEDTYDDKWYKNKLNTSSIEPCNRADGSDMVLRGGSFIDDGSFSKATDRGYSYIQHTDSKVGFRCVKSNANRRVKPNKLEYGDVEFKTDELSIYADVIVFENLGVKVVNHPALALKLKEHPSSQINGKSEFTPTREEFYGFYLAYNSKWNLSFRLTKIESKKPNHLSDFLRDPSELSQVFNGQWGERTYFLGIDRVRGEGTCGHGIKGQRCAHRIIDQLKGVTLLPLSDSSYIECTASVRGESNFSSKYFWDYFNICQSLVRL